MYGILSAGEIEYVLSRQVLGRLGCHAEGTTYVVPINFTYDGQFIYCYTQEGLKMTLMRKNAEVCFQTDDIENMANWKSVVVWGRFEELPEGPEYADALQKLVNRVLPIISSERVHQSAEWPFPSNGSSPEIGFVFRIRVTKKTGRFERSTHSTLIA